MCNYIISNIKTKLGYFTLITVKKKIIGFYPSNNKKEKIYNNDLHKIFLKTVKKYFLRKTFNFKFQLQLIGTDFEKKVWNEISKIHYGSTKTYKDIAKLLKTSPRSIGNACSKNKCLLIIPCHRVICSNGKIGGYILGNKIKEYLIKLEKNGT